MRCAGHSIVNYVDDYVPIWHSVWYKMLIWPLIWPLWLPRSHHQSEKTGTSQHFCCISGGWNQHRKQSKLHQICGTVSEWKNRKYCTKRQLQSLLDHLLYIHKCVKPARYFLNRMLELLREYHGQTRIHLNPEFHRDLRWFERFLPLYNGISLYDHQKPDHQVHLDACLQGLGGVWQNMVYHMVYLLGSKVWT